MLSTEYNRLFTFGCSFTDYHWITWADIVAAYLDIESYNFGMPGSNITGIAWTILQADRKYKFTPKDCIMVEWTNIGRDYRLVKDYDYVTVETFYHTDRDTFCDLTGDLRHVFSNLQQMYTIEKAFNINSVHMVNSQNYLDMIIEALYKTHKSDVEHMCEMYAELLNKPNFVDTVFDGAFNFNKNKYDIQDDHPLPNEHYAFCNKIFGISLNQSLQEKIDKSTDEVVRILYKVPHKHFIVKNKIKNLNAVKYQSFPNKWNSCEI